MIADLVSYPGYKDSRLPWLGLVPAHWDVQRLKYVSTLHGRIGFHGLSSNDYSDDGIIAVSGTNFKNWQVDWDECHRIPEAWYDKDPNIQLREGDLLITKDGTIGKTAIVLNLPGRAVLNSGVMVVRPRWPQRYNNRYLLYVINSDVFDSFIDLNKTGATINHLYEATFGNFAVMLPPLQEQTAITAFLDHINRRIRRSVLAKQKLIRLLEEQKQAIIRRAVTRGLNADIRVKPSPAGWLGDVPEHWETPRLGQIAKIFNGATPSRSVRDYWEGGTIPWLSSGKVNDGIVETPSEFVTLQAVKDTSIALVPKGSVIIGLIGQGKTRGMTAVLGIDACINQNLAAIVPRRGVEGDFVRYALSSFYRELRELGRGGNQEALNCEIVANFRVALPPETEQKAICSYLDTALTDIRCVEDSAKAEMTLLLQYRRRLISDAVSGLIDVREAAANLPSESEELDDLSLREEAVEDIDGTELAPDELGQEEMIA